MWEEQGGSGSVNSRCAETTCPHSRWKNSQSIHTEPLRFSWQPSTKRRILFWIYPIKLWIFCHQVMPPKKQTNKTHAHAHMRARAHTRTYTWNNNCTFTGQICVKAMRNKLFVWGHNSSAKNKMSHGVVSIASVRVHIFLLRGSIINGEPQNVQMGFCVFGEVMELNWLIKIVLTSKERERGLLLLPQNVCWCRCSPESV